MKVASHFLPKEVLITAEMGILALNLKKGLGKMAVRKERHYYRQYIYEKQMVIKKKGDQVMLCFLLTGLLGLGFVYLVNLDFQAMLVGLGLLSLGHLIAYGYAKKKDDQKIQQVVQEAISQEILLKKLKAGTKEELLQLIGQVLNALPFYEEMTPYGQSGGSAEVLLGFFKDQPLLVGCYQAEDGGFGLVKVLGDLASQMNQMGIKRTMVITNGQFSEGNYNYAQYFTKPKRLVLIDPLNFLAMAKQAGFLMDLALIQETITQHIAEKGQMSLKESATKGKSALSCFIYGAMMLCCALAFELFYLYFFSALFLFALGIVKLILRGKISHQPANLPLWEED